MVMKVYSSEFKADAVALYHSDPDLTIVQAARDLGVNPETLRNWIRAGRRTGGDGTTRNDVTSTDPADKATREDLEARIKALENDLRTARKEITTLSTERDILRKATKYFASGDELVSRFQFVEDHCETYPIRRLCQVLDLQRSSFYKWRSAAPARQARERADAALAARIRQVHTDSDGAYGAPRVTAELNDPTDGNPRGRPVNKKRIARVMRRFGIVGTHLRKTVRTTVPEPSAAAVPDLFGRDFTAPEPNRKYMGDITYLPVGDGEFLYLATVPDCFSRRVIGWSIAGHMRTSLVADALKMAAAARGSLAGAVFHSDHGAQYGSREFADLCAELGVTQSMGAVGTSADNAACESFHASLKRELLKGARRWPGAAACRAAVFCWLTRYKRWRRHSANGRLSPAAYEIRHTQRSTNMTLTA
ncbi:IS3 family transposase [Streptomyces sp. NPDC057910]|uniref:IS3 family transposase n=1 Tax=Streptomyces sp. NPDC057910 TaxID=3346278 RepID=UPI0036E94223